MSDHGSSVYLEKKVFCILYFTDTLRNEVSPSRISPSNSTQMSGGTTQSQNNIMSNQQGTATNGTVPFGCSYMGYPGIAQPLHTLPPYLLNYFGPRPQLSVVREDSREQEAEMESTSTESLDEIQSTSSVNDDPAVSDLKLDMDSKFEVMSVLSSTPLLDDSPATMV